MIKHHTFLAAANAGDLSAQIRLARETARKLVLHGIDGPIKSPIASIDELAGGPYQLATLTSGGDWQDYYTHHIDAAFALGIVIGQLVHPDVFKTGGAK